MAFTPASTTIFTVDSSKAVPVSVPSGATVTVRNDGSTLYYGSPSVTSSSNDGSLATATSIDLTGTKYLITAFGTTTQVIVRSDDAISGSTPGKPYGITTWEAPTATSGTDTACTSGTAYVGSIFVPVSTAITGIQYLVGSVGGTDKVVASLHNANGTPLANSATAGTTVGTAAQVQQVPLTATYNVNAGTYYVGLTFNGTTAKFRSIPAHTQNGAVGNGVTQTFGTVAAFTPPTTFTADKVPVLSLY